MDAFPEEIRPFVDSFRELLAKAKSASKVDVLAAAIYASSKGNRFGDVLVLALSDDAQARKAVNAAIRRAVAPAAPPEAVELGLQLVAALALKRALERQDAQQPDVHPVADRREPAPPRVQDDCPGTCSLRPRWG